MRHDGFDVVIWLIDWTVYVGFGLVLEQNSEWYITLPSALFVLSSYCSKTGAGSARARLSVDCC